MKKVLRSTCMAVALLTTNLQTIASSHAFDVARLHSVLSQTYTLTLSGHVRSLGEAGAGADVWAEAKTSKRHAVEAITTTGTDGSFTLTLSFKSYPDEPLDWTLTVQTDPASRVIVEGRQILSDKTDLRIEKSIQLTEGQLALAVH